MTVVYNNAEAAANQGSVVITEIDGSPVATSIKILKFPNTAVTDNGDGSVSIATGIGGGDAATNTAVSVDGEVSLFSGTGGKTLKRSTLTGVLKSAAGVLQVATASTDYAPATSGSAILMGNGAGGFTASVVNNTTDANKPISTATQTALDLKSPIASPTFTGTVSGITSTMVGLGNVNNTADASKPISGAAQTALDLKAPLAGPSFTGNINVLLQATENVVIDARTHPRTSLTTGVLRINHTAGKTGTRPLSIDVNAAGFSDTHTIAINYTATDLTAGSENHGLDFSVDTSNSSGGDIAALSVSKTGTGLIRVAAIEAYPGVHVLDQQVGITGVADSNFTYNSGAYTLATTPFGAAGNDVQVFVANTDYIYIGHSIKFNIIDVALSVVASDGGIIPTFEYSNGANSFAVFSPGDTTNGFRQNGTITVPELSSWITRTVNSVAGKYWIRIRRTNAIAITPPTESAIKIIVSTSYSWNNLGNITASKLNLANLGTFGSNASAISGGLVAGDLYKSSGGALSVVV